MTTSDATSDVTQPLRWPHSPPGAFPGTDSAVAVPSKPSTQEIHDNDDGGNFDEPFDSFEEGTSDADFDDDFGDDDFQQPESELAPPPPLSLPAQQPTPTRESTPRPAVQQLPLVSPHPNSAVSLCNSSFAL